MRSVAMPPFLTGDKGNEYYFTVPQVTMEAAGGGYSACAGHIIDLVHSRLHVALQTAARQGKHTIRKPSHLLCPSYSHFQ